MFLNKLQLIRPKNFQGENGDTKKKGMNLESEGKRWIPHVWCSSHLTALGASAGNENCQIAAQFEEDMMSINADFTSSAVRIATLVDYRKMIYNTTEKYLRITPWRKCR